MEQPPSSSDRTSAQHPPADGTAHALPKSGWTCVDIIDLGRKGPWPVCEWCETATPRYRHQMEHPDLPGLTLDTGCVCAGWLEQDPDAARERETEFRLRQSRRENWLMRRTWRISKRGNSYLNTRGCNVVVWQTLTGWRFRIVHSASGVGWESNAPLPSERDAKLASFDCLPRNFPEFAQRIAEAERG